MKKILTVLMVTLLISAMLFGCVFIESPDSQRDETEDIQITQTPEFTNDLATLLLGRWTDEADGIVFEFFDDGTYTVTDAESIVGDTYTTEQLDDNTIILTGSDGSSSELIFTDEYTIDIDGATLMRVTQDESISEPEDGTISEDADDSEYYYDSEDTAVSDSSPDKLLIGAWAENTLMVFDDAGNLTVSVSIDEDEYYTYYAEVIDASTLTIYITDSDGITTSETAYFIDNDTLVIGDITFSRNS